MRVLTYVMGLGIAAMAAMPCASALSDMEVRLRDADLVLTEAVEIPEDGIPRALLENAEGVLVIPSMMKAGFIIGARYGKGVLCIRRDDGSWSAPLFVTLAGLGAGWQAGIQATDLILVFRNKRSVLAITDGKFTLAADVALALGPLGRQAEMGTDFVMRSEIYSYSRSRGLFAGLSLEGAALNIDHQDNAVFYRAQNRTAEELLRLSNQQIPTAALSFTDRIAQLAAPKPAQE